MMRSLNWKNLWTLIGLMSVLLCAGNSRASVIYSNLGPADSFNTFIGAGVFSSPPPVHDPDPPGWIIYDVRFAAPFSTGSFDWTFGSVELALRNTSDTDAFEVSIMSDAGGLPGQSLQTIHLSGVPTSPSLVTVFAADPLVLHANTTYWIALSADIGAGCEWYNHIGAGDSAANIDGAGWLQAPGGCAMRVHGAVVPEPGALSAAGLVAFFAMCRRTRRNDRCAATARQGDKHWGLKRCQDADGDVQSAS